MGCVGFCKNVTTDHAFTNLHTQTQRAAELPLYIIYHNHQLIHFKLHCMHCILDAKKSLQEKCLHANLSGLISSPTTLKWTFVPVFFGM